jgi:hypothetical protein
MSSQSNSCGRQIGSSPKVKTNIHMFSGTVKYKYFFGVFAVMYGWSIFCVDLDWKTNEPKIGFICNQCWPLSK